MTTIAITYAAPSLADFKAACDYARQCGMDAAPQVTSALRQVPNVTDSHPALRAYADAKGQKCFKVRPTTEGGKTSLRALLDRAKAGDMDARAAVAAHPVSEEQANATEAAPDEAAPPAPPAIPDDEEAY